jgi:hypothetical protein
MRTLRSLAVGHDLGHVLVVDEDRDVSLLCRLIQHLATTLKYNIYYGAERDYFDEPGRVAHEVVFNPDTGSYRYSTTQQGFSPFSTWTRGLAWALLGLAEIGEYLDSLPEDSFSAISIDGMETKRDVVDRVLSAAKIVGDFYIEHSCVNGIPYWDTAAPGIQCDERRYEEPDPYTANEPVDSAAAAIAAQGFMILGRHLEERSDASAATRYTAAGVRIAKTIFDEPYLSTRNDHDGLLLHAHYNRPGAWDNVPHGRSIPCDESTMWGDYHALELAVLINREATGTPPYRFFSS